MPQPFVIKNHVVFPIKTTRPSLPGYLPGGWSRRLPLTCPAGTVSSDQTNVTALIDITTPSLRTVANGGFVTDPDGADIAFAAVGGETPQRLGHDLRSYDPVTGHIVAWVQVPAIAALADTTINLHFGLTDAPAVDRAGAWSGWDGVLAGDDNGTLVLDATGYHRHAKPLPGTVAAPITGHDAYAIATVLKAPDAPARRRALVSFWFKHSGLAGTGYQSVYSHERTGVAGIEIAFRRTGSGGDQVRVHTFDADVDQTFFCDATIDDGAWHLLHLAWDDATGAALYLDGVAVAVSSGTATGLNTRCEPGSPVLWGNGYTGSLFMLRSAWRPWSADAAEADYLGQTAALFTSVGAIEVVPTITQVAGTEYLTPFSFTDDIIGLPLTIDYNLYLQPETLPVAHLVNPPPLTCASSLTLDRTCWSTAFPAFDVHSKWMSTSVNLDKYQNPLNYQQQLSINTKLAVRTWHCDAPTVAYPTCDDTDQYFIQYLGSSDGIEGFFNPVTYTDADANLTTNDYRATVGPDGFLTTIPTSAP